jgi:integrase
MKVAQLVIAEDDLWLRRAQAAFCLQAASAARAHALVTLPLKAIDLDGLWVRQDPGLGVWTKNDVRATTCLMDMQELLTPVRNWYAFLMQRVGSNALFFNPFDRSEGGLVPTQKLAGDNRVNALIDDYQALCPIAGIPYRGTHGLRRFHIGFILMRCKDIDDFQALSHNLMHKKLSTTELYVKPKQDKLASRYRQSMSSESVASSPQQVLALAEQQVADNPKMVQMVRAAMKEVLAEYMGSKGGD